MILERQEKIEIKCENNTNLVTRAWEITENFKELFERDYKEFVRDRRRWKSDFDAAS